MADARTKLDIIYQDVLGDVHEILNRVDTLKSELPAAADAMADKLNIQTGNYLAAAGKLAEVLQNMSQEIDRAAAQAAATAGESARLDVRQAATQAASGAIRDTVGAEVREVVGFINEAAANLVQEAERSKTEISKAARLVSWRFGRVLAVVVLGGILGGLVAVLAAPHMPGMHAGAQAAQLSDADRQAIENGAKIQKVWNSLTPKERDHINALLREGQ